ncbi:hypothetical protein [Sphingobium chungbukense]|uniref:AcrB/AcrD/AcrF family protein n=1 Tax=Sphingobium chungbukense TaxID=56193 RepID=A0A0M3AUC1_9SPHN|nr:hypothetical protein [Sphingobium chungbukense]KKW93440.1 hypothetical protein YP76_01725 [Sphingobium chungbukense]
MNLQSWPVLRARVAPVAAKFSVYAERHWKWLTVLLWIFAMAWLIAMRWPQIHWLTLSDTDDNIRYVQVKDWLAGQGWYDLRQYRLDPPAGFNIHWSRLVDLPIAGLMLFFRAFVDQGLADRLACGIAPMLPLLPLMLGLGFIARRLAGGNSWFLAALAPFAAQMGIGMFMPMRIDHHGWQLAFTVLMLAELIDRNWLRGGIVAGVSSALSIAIGMEMIVYLAAGGALIALRWVFKEGAARRMLPYALSLAGATSLSFLLFASHANREMVCDAISPIWVAIFAAASAGMALLALLPLRSWPARLGAGIVVGAAVAVFAWLNWPQCLTGAYQISPELERLWLANIREAKPITVQPWSLIVPLMAIPAAGLIGLIWALWDSRRDTDRLWAWATVGLMMLFSTALLFWQLRAGPAAQLLAIPPAAWAAYRLLCALGTGRPLVRGLALVGMLLLAAVAFATPLYPQINLLWTTATGAQTKPQKPAVQARRKAIDKANGRCRTLPSLQVLDQLPAATIFTMVDLGPRLIAVTHHSAVAGPYHRNGAVILDMHHAYDGPAAAFRPIAARHHATYLLVCPGFPEGTIYQARSPKGFYAGLMRGEVPDWLEPVALKTGITLPYTLYRIDYGAPR